MKSFVVWLLLALGGSVAFAETGFFGSLWRYKESRGLRYCRANGLDLHLDLYQPRDKAPARPGVVLIHGGGWVTGSRRWMNDYAAGLARRGFVVANIDYRLALTPKVPDPQVRRYQVAAPFPAAVQDAKCAVRWLRTNAAAYGVDPDRIAAVGDSAGGNLALMLGFTPDLPEFLGGDLSVAAAAVSSSVRSVVNLYGVPDMKEGAISGPQETLKQIGSGMSCYQRYVGCAIDACPERWKAASPSSYLRLGYPGVPVLTIHGTKDSLVPYALAVSLDHEMARRGQAHRLLPAIDAEHGLTVPGNKKLSQMYLERAREEIATFLIETMKK